MIANLPNKSPVALTSIHSAEINPARIAQIEERLLAEIDGNPEKARLICDLLVRNGIQDGCCWVAFECGNSSFNYMASDLSAVLMIARHLSGKMSLEGAGDCYLPDVDLAARYFKEAADMGCSRSLKELHTLYIEGRGTKFWDFPHAMEYLTQEAAQENKDAAYRLGVIYKEGFVKVDEQGYGFEDLVLVGADIKKSLQYLKQAADQYHPEALYLLGLHVEENGPADGLLSAETYFNLASNANQLIYEKDHLNAQSSLEKIYFKGNGIRSLAYLIEADQNGNSAATFRLGELYAQGTFVQKDAQKAVDFFKKAAAAKFPEALFQLGEIYLNGNESMLIKKDQPLAMDYLKQAANLNHAKAAFVYGMELLKQRGQVDDEILGYFKIADANGNSDAPYQLYVFYDQRVVEYEKATKIVHDNLWKQVEAGSISVKNFTSEMDLWSNSPECPPNTKKEADFYFKNALDRNNPEALYQFGKTLIRTLGNYRSCFNNSNFEEVKLYLGKAAEQGHAEAAFLLARCWLNFFPQTRNEHQGIVQNEIIKWLNIAANKGFPAALYLLGQLHSNDKYYRFNIPDEVERQLTIESCFKKAADQGHPEAAFDLAEMYSKRSWSWSMTPPFTDPKEEATKYYGIAAKLGHSMAQQKLDQKSVLLSSTLNSAELSKILSYGCPAALYQDAMIKFSGKNQLLAEQQLSKAAKAGHPGAIAKLSQLHYERGQMYESLSFSFADPWADNQAKAIQCYVEAANLGHENSAMRLGEIYESRIGSFFPKLENVTKAQQYYSIAAKLGNAHANGALTRLSKFGAQEINTSSTITLQNSKVIN